MNPNNLDPAELVQAHRLNPNWLEDHQAHEAMLADTLRRPLTPPRAQVATVMADVAQGDHNDRVEDLVGDMLRTTPRRLFANRPDVRDLVYRAIAEELLEPNSPWHTEALDHLEAQTRSRAVEPGRSPSGKPLSS